MRRKVYVVYGEGAVTDQMCQKWFVKFRAGDFLLDDAPRLGRQVDSDQIETLLEINQHSVTREIADILKILKSIGLLVKMKKCVFYFMEKAYRLLGQPNIRKSA